MKQNKIMSKVASTLALAGAAMPYLAGGFSARADDVTDKPVSALESAIDSLSLTSRGYADGSGFYQSHQILSNDFAKFAYRGETGSNVYGLDIPNAGKFSEGLEGFRLNTGYQDFVGKDSANSNGRLIVEKSFKNSTLDFANLELQDNAGQRQVAVAGGLVLKVNDDMDFKPQATMDDKGNYCYAVVWNANKNGGLGANVKSVNDLEAFNLVGHYKFGDDFGVLSGYKVRADAKAFQTSTSSSADSYEFRVILGKKTAGGNFLAGNQDTLKGSISPFLGGDGDATLPFGIGDGNTRTDFFGAASANSGELGSFSFDAKFHDEPISKYGKLDVAVGLGSVSPRFLKNNVLQVGAYHDFLNGDNDSANIELRSTILSDDSKDNSWSVDFGVRQFLSKTGDNETSAFLGLNYRF